MNEAKIEPTISGGVPTTFGGVRKYSVGMSVNIRFWGGASSNTILLSATELLIQLSLRQHNNSNQFFQLFFFQ